MPAWCKHVKYLKICLNLWYVLVHSIKIWQHTQLHRDTVCANYLKFYLPGRISGLLQEAAASGTSTAQWHSSRGGFSYVWFCFTLSQQPWYEKGQDQGVICPEGWKGFCGCLQFLQQHLPPVMLSVNALNSHPGNILPVQTCSMCSVFIFSLGRFKDGSA